MKPKVMLLAAGRGERMRPLTDRIPKPLIEITANTTLIELHINRLKSIGFTDIVINLAWLGEKIVQLLGDGSRFGVTIEYSDEGDNALETAGGIINALDLLGAEPFIVINSDIYTDYDFKHLYLQQDKLAQLVLVPNPEFHREGDFFMKDNTINNSEGEKFTFSGIAMYHPDFFKGLAAGPLALGPLLRHAIADATINAEIYNGAWFDIGTPDRLSTIQNYLLNH
ncbi:MAG: N-acetylmuramate alpha-1-phosphate uridylyltransferase MurU [Gammaproteobacteria bacterium]